MCRCGSAHSEWIFGTLLEISRYRLGGCLTASSRSLCLNCRPRVWDTHREIFREPQVTGFRLSDSLPSLGIPYQPRGLLEHLGSLGEGLRVWQLISRPTLGEWMCPSPSILPRGTYVLLCRDYWSLLSPPDNKVNLSKLRLAIGKTNVLSATPD